MQSEASNGKNADLKAFAVKTAQVGQMHLDAIMKIQIVSNNGIINYFRSDFNSSPFLFL